MVPSLDVLEDLKFFAAFDFVVSRFPPGEGGQSLAQLATQAVNDAASNAGIDTVSSTITVSGSLGMPPHIECSLGHVLSVHWGTR